VLLVVIDEEVDRLNDLAGEAIKTARLVGVQLDLKPHTVEKIIGVAINHCKRRLGRRLISVQLKPGLKPVRSDLSLTIIALVELLENATKYSPNEQPIIITAELSGHFVIMSVGDRGGGINESE
jgi:two-component system sensor histidine kinase KdpD